MSHSWWRAREVLKKVSHIIWIIWQRKTGLNFINVLRTAFTLVDSRSVWKTVKSSVYFMFLGSTSLKTAFKSLVKLTLELNFTNVLHARFSYESSFKFAHRTLIKLTPGDLNISSLQQNDLNLITGSVQERFMKSKKVLRT